MKKILTLALLLSLPLVTSSDSRQMCDQGAPGRQGAWPVTSTTTTPVINKEAASTAGVYGEVAVLTSATAVPSSAYSSRRSITIQNHNTSNAIYCGLNNSVTTGTGLKIATSGGSAVFPVSSAITVYCISASASQSSGATPSTATTYMELN